MAWDYNRRAPAKGHRTRVFGQAETIRHHKVTNEQKMSTETIGLQKTDDGQVCYSADFVPPIYSHVFLRGDGWGMDFRISPKYQVFVHGRMPTHEEFRAVPGFNNSDPLLIDALYIAVLASTEEK
jgi:hypothetical protein